MSGRSLTRNPQPMVVIDDRQMNNVTRRRNRFVSMFQTQATGQSFLNYEDKSYRKAKRKNLWGTPDLGTGPVKMTCPNCRHAINTVVVYEQTWRSFVAMCCFSIIGLCFIPIMFRLWQDGVHYCPLCHTYLGRGHSCHTWRYDIPSWFRCKKGRDQM